MGIKIIAKNKKAFHDFQIFQSFEAGIALQGTEVKSIRLGKINLSDGWVEINNYEAFLKDVHISPYSHGNIMNHEEKRTRKLLLKHNELVRLDQKIFEKGFTIIPLKIYFKDSLIKVEIALAKGKKLFDKREAEKKKESQKVISQSR